jgi:hypothetical protein
MTGENSKKAGVKKKVAHEFEELAGIFLYLAFFFFAIATYSMLLLDKFHVSYFVYGTALINALVIAKVILIGEYAHLGKRQEARPLILSALNKAFLFGMLVFAFHIVEETVKHLIHGETMASAWRGIRIDDLLARSVVIFCTFIPLFAFRELRRVIGEDNFWDLFFRTGALARNQAKFDLPGGI